MISSIKRIKDVGVFKDFETRRTGLQKDFGKKNFVYGPNTYGKSTICDILKDISDDTAERIKKRLTIPNGANQDIILNLSDGAGTIKLSNNSWSNNNLKKRIMVFDTEFMMNNVFDGTNLIEDRTTKENFTEFILGDKGVALAHEIEELKREIKEEKAKLPALAPNSQKGESDATIKKYIRQEVQEKIEDLEEIKGSLFKKIKNNEQRENDRIAIRDYKEIEAPNYNKLTTLINEMEKVKEILETSYSMTANTVITFEKHIREVCHGLNGAQEWISQGIHFMADDSVCPFCGQEIEDKSLLNAFSEYLCDDFRLFKQNLSQRIKQVSFDWDVLTLSKDVVDLQKTVKKAEELFGETVAVWNEDIENLYQEIVLIEKSFGVEFSCFREKVNSVLKSKIVLCNVKVDLETDILKKIKDFYDEKIEDIGEIINKINNAVLIIKADINETL